VSRGAAQGAFRHHSWDGSEGGEEVFHMPAGVICITEEQFFCQRDFDILGTGYPQRGGWQWRRGGTVRAWERMKVGV